MVLDNELGTSRKNLQVEFKTIREKNSPRVTQPVHRGERNSTMEMCPENSFSESHLVFVDLTLLKPFLGKTVLGESTGAATLGNASCCSGIVALCLDCFLGGPPVLLPDPEMLIVRLLSPPQSRSFGDKKSEHKTAGEEGRLFLKIHEVLKSSEFKRFQTVSLPASC